MFSSMTKFLFGTNQPSDQDTKNGLHKIPSAHSPYRAKRKTNEGTNQAN
jgi:hypothetical protein